MHLVTRGHFRSRDKYGGFTIQSTVLENPTLHANIKALCLIQRVLLPIEVLHCRNRNFRPFWLVWPWPWPDDLHIRTQPAFPGDILHVRKWTSNVHYFESYHLTDIQTYRRPKLYTTPLRGWSRTIKYTVPLHSSMLVNLYTILETLMDFVFSSAALTSQPRSHTPWNVLYASVAKVRLVSLWPWPSTSDFSAMRTHMMDICAKFRASSKYRDIASRTHTHIGVAITR